MRLKQENIDSGTLREHWHGVEKVSNGVQEPRRRRSMTTQKVQVFALGLPKEDLPKDRRRWTVRWRIDGRDRMRKFKSRAQAERLRSQLLVAVSAADPFDPASGLPLEWVRTDLSFFEWARQWLALKWPAWAGNSRRAGVEVLVAFTPHLISDDAPPPPIGGSELRHWLYEVAFNPNVELDEDSPEARWLNRYSLGLSEIGAGELEVALSRGLLKRDGKMVAATTASRRKNLLSTVLKAAVRRKLIPANPMDAVEWRNPRSSKRLDIATVPSAAEIDALVELVAASDGDDARYAAMFELMGLAGLRPSEVAGLRPADLSLPLSGWGLIRLGRATASPGERYTTADGPFETKELKHRAVGDVREVPLPPRTVDRVRSHIERFPPTDGLVFVDAKGRPVASAGYSRAFRRARNQLWPEGHLLGRLVPYDLRHSAATIMLRAGVPPAEVAIRLGHSVDMLNKVYAGVFDGERTRSNALIDQELDKD